MTRSVFRTFKSCCLVFTRAARLMISLGARLQHWRPRPRTSLLTCTGLRLLLSPRKLPRRKSLGSTNSHCRYNVPTKCVVYFGSGAPHNELWSLGLFRVWLCAVAVSRPSLVSVGHAVDLYNDAIYFIDLRTAKAESCLYRITKPRRPVSYKTSRCQSCVARMRHGMLPTSMTPARCSPQSGGFPVCHTSHCRQSRMRTASLLIRAMLSPRVGDDILRQSSRPQSTRRWTRSIRSLQFQATTTE